MASMNQFVVVGNLTADPEAKESPGKKAVCDFTVAVDRPERNGESEADFLSVRAFDKTAHAMSKHLTKGASVLVVGHLRHERWEDKESKEPRSRIALIADRVQFLSARKTKEGSNKPEEVEEAFSEERP